jgi:hypothetical protein
MLYPVLAGGFGLSAEFINSAERLEKKGNASNTSAVSWQFSTDLDQPKDEHMPFIVIGDNVNVRDNPSVGKSKVLTRLPLYRIVRVDGRAGTESAETGIYDLWYHVVSSDIEGWVNAQYLAPFPSTLLYGMKLVNIGWDRDGNIVVKTDSHLVIHLSTVGIDASDFRSALIYDFSIAPFDKDLEENGWKSSVETKKFPPSTPDYIFKTFVKGKDRIVLWRNADGTDSFSVFSFDCSTEKIPALFGITIGTPVDYIVSCFGKYVETKGQKLSVLLHTPIGPRGFVFYIKNGSVTRVVYKAQWD